MSEENRMKYQTLRIIAALLGILAWVVAVVGVITAIIIGVAAATVIAKIWLLLGGFVITAVYALMLLAASRFIYLFIDIEQDLSEIATLIENKQKSK